MAEENPVLGDEVFADRLSATLAVTGTTTMKKRHKRGKMPEFFFCRLTRLMLGCGETSANGLLKPSGMARRQVCLI